VAISRRAWIVTGGILVGIGALVYLVQRPSYRRAQEYVQAVRRQKQGPASVGNVEQAVIVNLRLSDQSFGSPAERDAIHALSDRLEMAIAEAQVGEFDGDEFGEGKCLLYMYGPDAQKLFGVVEPVLRSSPMVKGGWVIKRFGRADQPNVTVERVSL
jgi:hypothetical protein